MRSRTSASSTSWRKSRWFDADGSFIRRYVPELKALGASDIHAPWLVPATLRRAKGVVIGCDYPAPAVDHAVSRAAALARYKEPL